MKRILIVSCAMLSAMSLYEFTAYVSGLYLRPWFIVSFSLAYGNFMAYHSIK